MVYSEVFVTVVVAVIHVVARETPPAAEWPSGPAAFVVARDKETHSTEKWPSMPSQQPIYNSASMSREKTSSGYWKSNAVKAQITPCDLAGGYCLKKINVNRCNAQIESKYQCKTIRHTCCISASATNAPTTLIPTIEVSTRPIPTTKDYTSTTPEPTTDDTMAKMIQEILRLINNQDLELQSLKGQMKDNQETLLSNTDNFNSEINKKLKQVKDNQNTLLNNVKVELNEVKDEQETLLIDVKRELNRVEDNQGTLLNNIKIELNNVKNKQNSLLNTINIEHDEAEDNRETLLNNVKIELNQVNDNQETLLNNVKMELNEVKDNQDSLLNNVKIELDEVEDNQESLLNDFKIEINQVEDNQDTLLNDVKIELNGVKDKQEKLLNNVQIELDEVENNQEALLSNVKIELNHVKNSQEKLVDNVQTELNHVQNNQESILNNIKQELSQAKSNQETLMNNITNSNSEIVMQLSQVKENQKTLIRDVNIDFNYIKKNQATLLNNVQTELDKAGVNQESLINDVKLELSQMEGKVDHIIDHLDFPTSRPSTILATATSTIVDAPTIFVTTTITTTPNPSTTTTTTVTPEDFPTSRPSTILATTTSTIVDAPTTFVTTTITTTPNPPTTNTIVTPGALVEIDWSRAKFGQTSSFDGYGADKAFLTSWQFFHSYVGVPQALWVGFAVPVPVVKFSFQSATKHSTWKVQDGPTKYVFFGSNSADCSNSSTWEPLFEDDSGTSFTGANTPKTELVPGNKSFTCYGFNVKEVGGSRSDGGKFVQMDNIKLYTTGLQEMDLDNVGIKATSSHGSHEAPENALLISGPGNSHLWQSAQGKLTHTPQSIWYQFPIPVVVAEYSFQSRFDSHVVNCGPTSYEFFGSNADDCSDQSAWETLVQDLSDTPFTADNIPKTGEIPNPQPYMCYGFKVLKIPSNYGSSLTNIRFFTPRN